MLSFELSFLLRAKEDKHGMGDIPPSMYSTQNKMLYMCKWSWLKYPEMLESLVRPYIIKNDMRQNAFFPYLQEIKMPSSAGSLNTWCRKKRASLKIILVKWWTTRTYKKMLFFLISKLTEIWMKYVPTRRKWRTRNIEISKYFHLKSYKYFKIL